VVKVVSHLSSSPSVEVKVETDASMDTSVDNHDIKHLVALRRVTAKEFGKDRTGGICANFLHRHRCLLGLQYCKL
jgi:hypothetical protein